MQRAIPFTRMDLSHLRSLASWLRIGAGAYLVTAVVALVPLFQGRIDLGAILRGLLAVWMFQAANRFQTVADKDRDDLSQMADGLRMLGRVFLLQAVVVLLVLAISAIVNIAWNQ